VCSKDTFNDLIKKHTFKFDYTFFESPSDDKLAELYSSSDLFVFASHIEGYGLPPLEAMACGTPVVTTDCRGVRDFVVDGENAILVPPKEPEVLAESILKAYNDVDLTEKLKENGLETAKNLTWSRVVDVFERAFIEALKSNEKYQ
jgi:Glycosyltransferase